MVVVDMLHRILDSLSEALSKHIYGYLYMCVCIFPKQAQRGGVLTCFLIPNRMYVRRCAAGLGNLGIWASVPRYLQCLVA